MVAGSVQTRDSLIGASKMLSIPIIMNRHHTKTNERTKICPKIWLLAIVLSFMKLVLLRLFKGNNHIYITSKPKLREKPIFEPWKTYIIIIPKNISKIYIRILLYHIFGKCARKNGQRGRWAFISKKRGEWWGWLIEGEVYWWCYLWEVMLIWSAFKNRRKESAWHRGDFVV